MSPFFYNITDKSLLINFGILLNMTSGYHLIWRIVIDTDMRQGH